MLCCTLPLQDLFILFLEVCTSWPPLFISPTPTVGADNLQSDLCFYEFFFI